MDTMKTIYCLDMNTLTASKGGNNSNYCRRGRQKELRTSAQMTNKTLHQMCSWTCQNSPGLNGYHRENVVGIPGSYHGHYKWKIAEGDISDSWLQPLCGIGEIVNSRPRGEWKWSSTSCTSLTAFRKLLKTVLLRKRFLFVHGDESLK